MSSAAAPRLQPPAKPVLRPGRSDGRRRGCRGGPRAAAVVDDDQPHVHAGRAAHGRDALGQVGLVLPGEDDHADGRGHGFLRGDHEGAEHEACCGELPDRRSRHRRGRGEADAEQRDEPGEPGQRGGVGTAGGHELDLRDLRHGAQRDRQRQQGDDPRGGWRGGGEDEGRDERHGNRRQRHPDHPGPDDRGHEQARRAAAACEPGEQHRLDRREQQHRCAHDHRDGGEPGGERRGVGEAGGHEHRGEVPHALAGQQQRGRPEHGPDGGGAPHPPGASLPAAVRPSAARPVAAGVPCSDPVAAGAPSCMPTPATPCRAAAVSSVTIPANRGEPTLMGRTPPGPQQHRRHPRRQREDGDPRGRGVLVEHGEHHRPRQPHARLDPERGGVAPVAPQPGERPPDQVGRRHRDRADGEQRDRRHAAGDQRRRQPEQHQRADQQQPGVPQRRPHPVRPGGHGPRRLQLDGREQPPSDRVDQQVVRGDRGETGRFQVPRRDGEQEVVRRGERHLAARDVRRRPAVAQHVDLRGFHGVTGSISYSTTSGLL